MLCICLGGLPQPHAEYSTDTVIYKGGPQTQSGARGPLPNVSSNKHQFVKSNNFVDQAEEEFPPPPPERGSVSGDNSLNDSNSTTQSNVTSECSEAECDREPLVKQRGKATEHVIQFNNSDDIFLSHCQYAPPPPSLVSLYS